NVWITVAIIYMVAIIASVISLSVLLLYQLNKASARSKSLQEGMNEPAASTEAIDFNKTLVISMMLEVITVGLSYPPVSGSILMFLLNDENSSNPGSGKDISLYIYFIHWFVMSSTFFNFLLYNLRIPAFRSKSLNIIKTGVKSCFKMLSSK
ncbi:unnamed protein product, partial [Meganyctiphanes norvegica]